ncbi:MAG: DUF2958 domain-containing protein [Bacteroidetes bacterium]|nr:DUF2958 domain-containing protein [Bacteroidota bacterium]
MKLFTDEQYQKLLDNGKPENRDQDHAPVVKLFLPGTGATWLLSELDHEEVTIAFGLCDLGMGFPELGSVLTIELEEIKHPHFGLPVERDLHFEGKYPLSVYADAARMTRCITEDDDLLQQAQAAQRHKRRNRSPE